jgi:hypothetical protein
MTTRRPAARGGRLALLTLAVLACDDLLKVDSPLRVPAGALDNPALAEVLVRSAIGDFECAFGNYVAITANLTDEFFSSATTANSGIDLRRRAQFDGLQVTGCAVNRGTPSNQLYIPLQTARFQADDIYRRLEAFTDAQVERRAELMATVAAYAGYVYTLFGEGFCTSAFNLGPTMTPPAILAIAEQRFTVADSLATLAGSADLRNFAHIGRARVRLDLGRRAESAADARLVSANYIKNATYSSDSPRRQNQIFIWNNFALWSTVDPRFRNLDVGGVPDTRIPAVDGGRNGVDGRNRLWLSGKYTSDGSPIPIATWEEAQLIIAEAEGGQSAVDRINALRTKYALPLFASTDSATIVQQVREERRRQLYLQGHRLNDMLRFGLPFDSGSNPKGEYGNVTCMPLPAVETRNNPSIP